MIALDRITDLILNSITIGVMVVDLTSHVVFLNREGEEILGETAESLLGKAIISGERFVPFVVLINDHRKVNPSLSVSQRQVAGEFIRSDGRQVNLGIRISNLVDESRTVLGYVVVFRDLTEIVELRAAVRQTESLASLGTMAAGVAHELRNPLHAIRAAVEMLQVRAKAGRPVDEYAEIAFSAVDRLNLLVEDVLAFSREPRLVSRALDPNKVVKQALSQVGKVDGVVQELVLAEGLPEVRMDADRVIQVLVNLIQNATEAQPDGGVVRVVTRLAGRRDLPGSDGIEALDFLEIRVEDEGPGIPEEHLPRIFEPFYTRRVGGGGTGLGLSICQRLVQAHRGAIEVQTRPGLGTSFSVLLPMAAAGKDQT